MTAYPIRRGGDPTVDALNRLGRQGVPIDPDVWLHVAALYAAERREKGKNQVASADPARWLDIAPDGRWYPTWSRRGADGRIYSDPTVGGIPRSVMREAIRANGNLIVCADWSASHVRILADLSGDEALIDEIAHGDIYGSVAADLGLDAVADRKRVKESVLASLNGQGIRARFERLPFSAHRLDDVMASRWPVAMTWCGELRAQAIRSGCVTTRSGRAVHAPKHHAAVGTLLRAEEADALVRAIRAVHGLEDAGFPLSLVMTIHDEIVVECHDPSRIQVVAALVGDAMGAATGFRPALKAGACEVTWGPSWGQQDGTTGAPRPLPGLPDGVVVLRPEPEVPWAHLDEIEAARAVVAGALGRVEEIRQQWYDAGLATRGKGCSTATIHSRGGDCDEIVTSALRCKGLGCIYCGPWRYALIEQSILRMPLVCPEGEVVGRPLGDRALFLYRFPADGLRPYLIAWRKAAQRERDRIPPIGASPRDRRNAILLGEAHGYVVFHVPDTGEVAVLTTIGRVYQRADKPQPVTPLHAESLVTSLTAEALTPVQQHEPYGRWRPRGRVSTSNNLHLDPREVVKQARKITYHRLPGPLGCSPREAKARATRLSKAVRTRWDEEGVVASVAVTAAELPGTVGQYVAILGREIAPDLVERLIDSWTAPSPSLPAGLTREQEEALDDALADLLDDDECEAPPEAWACIRNESRPLAERVQVVLNSPSPPRVQRVLLAALGVDAHGLRLDAVPVVGGDPQGSPPCPTSPNPSPSPPPSI